ncbi:hypothetical protein ACHAXH_002101 [Discostella pseudostelligera]
MKDYQSITKNETETVLDFGITTTLALAPATTNNRHQHEQHIQSYDHLAPPFDSIERKSNLFVATFNLIATIVGGVVLSLPIVFYKCGIAFTTISMILSAYMTYTSLMMLCLSSRRGGGSSYGEVVRSAFGERMEEGVSWLLFVFLMLVIIGYMVLIRDIWTPIAQEVFRLDIDGDHILLAITMILLPFIFQRSLHALRWNCYVGSTSIFVLCIALNRGGWQRIMESSQSSAISHIDKSHTTDFTIEFFKIPSTQDILFSFPITTCAFLCQFNIIAVQNSLSRPTRERTKQVIRYAIGASFALMYMFGLGGYLYAGNNPQGNILLIIPISRQAGEDEGEYLLFLLGRIGSGLTIMLAMPMMALPCREALLEVLDVWYHRSHHLTNMIGNVSARTDIVKCHWSLFHWCNITSESIQNAPIVTEDEVTEILPDSIEEEVHFRRSSILIRHEPIQNDYIFRNAIAHYGSSLMIISTCYLGAVAVNGVDVVWSFIGSSMAFVIAFILPCGAFIAIEKSLQMFADGEELQSKSIKIAWVILIFSVIGVFVCTLNSVFGSI